MKRQGRLAIIGAGPMGLATAYYLLRSGYKVDIYEKDDRIGGMSAVFDFDGLEIERFYHFITLPDKDLLELSKELGIYGKIKWTSTKMGFYYEGKLFDWGDPVSLLKFPHLNIIDKLRYGLHVFLSSKRTDQKNLDKITGIDWLKKSLGEKAYDVCWSSLFDYKFYEYKNLPSAAWIWSRVHRIGNSRENLLKDKLGYFKGGTKTFLDAMKTKIKSLGGKIYLKSEINKITIKNNHVIGLKVNGRFRQYNKIISTIPLPYLASLASDLPKEEYRKIKNIKNIGVVCAILRLKRPFSKYFWMNVNDKNIPMPGLIEYTNLNPLNKHVLYVPYYMPQSNSKFKKKEKHFKKEIIKYLKVINPQFNENSVESFAINKYYYAQPICTTRFLDKLPGIKSKIKGLFYADTSHCYPNDRYISESIKVGRRICSYILN